MIAPRTLFPAVRVVANRFVELAVVEKKFVEVAEVVVERVIFSKIFAPEKLFAPLNALLFERSVLEAAVIVISCEPLNAVPLIFREVWKRLAVPALPEIEPVMVLATESVPRFAAAANKLVEEAVAAKNEVEVAEVVVERVIITSVKPLRVVMKFNVVLAIRAASNLA